MAPWPEQGNEPKAPDKSCNKSVENSSIEASKVNLANSEETEVNATTSKCDDKQVEDRNAHVSSLDDGQLRALLDEAIAYKCPKDREGKSNLFRELLQEAEANEDGDSRRGLSGVCGSRYYSNSSRRKGRRDAQVSERQTRGGSLQNLVHASNSEFDPAAGFSGYHTGGSRTARRSKRLSTGSSYSGGSVGSSGSSRDCGGVSVSARQREGGSLPSNVNVGGMLTLGGLEYHSTPTSLPFDDIKTCKQVAVRRKELTHSSSSNEFMSMPVQTSTINTSSSGSSGVENCGTVSSTNSNCAASKAEFMVLDLGDYAGENTGESKGGSGGSVSISNNITSTSSASVDNGLSSTSQREEKNLADSNGTEEEGLELEVLQRAELTTRVPNYTSRATLEVGHSESKKILPSSSVIASEGPGDVDATVTFPLEILQCSEKSSSSAVNGVEQNSLQLRSSYNSVKSIMSSGSPCSGPRDEKSGVSKGSDIAKRSAGSETVGKAAAASAAVPTSASNVAASAMPMLSMQHHLSVLSLPPTSWINAPLVPDVNRLTFSHGSSKDCSGESKNQNKSLDENGNAVNRLESATSNSTERKAKPRKPKPNNDRNVIMSQNIEGYRGDKDIDTVLKFIESNSDGKGANKAKSTTSHSNGPMNFSNKQQRNCSRLIGCDRTKTRRERGLEDSSIDEGKTRASAGKQVTKENRGKSSKLKKSNSLEEISKTKLEDLTSNPKENENDERCADNKDEENSNVLIRRPKKQATLDNCEFYGEKNRVGDRRSWGTEEGQQYYCNDGVTVSADESSTGSSQNNRKRRGNNSSSNIIVNDEKRKNDKEDFGGAVSLPAPSSSGTNEETEFLVVTKKQRRKKRRSSSGGRGTSASTAGSIFGDDGWRPYHNNYSTSYYQTRESSSGSYYPRKTFTNTSSGFPPHDRTVERDSGGVMLYTQYRHHRPRSPDHLRRKSTSSMPPSDKSDSSDLDSVHSLPVSSTTQKLTLDQTSTSSGSTPQASYADIARMASNNVPSAPAHSNNYVNINLNASRWPVMGVPKNVANPVGNPSTTVTSVSTVSTIASSNSTASAPVVSSNPQFITGPKLNIGVPPVSGSKVAVVSGNNSSGLQSANVVSIPVTSSEDTCQGSVRKEPDAVQRSTVETASCKSRPAVLSSSDSRTKKDATTNTNSDYSTISPSSSEEKDVSHTSSGMKTSEVAVNLLKDGEYPSLEESLASDKPKSVKVAQVHSWHNSPAESISAVVPRCDSPGNDKTANPTVVRDSENEGAVNEKRSQVFVSNSNAGAGCATAGSSTVAVSAVALVSTKTCVPDSVSPVMGVSSEQSSQVLADVAKSNDTLQGKAKNVGKKVSSCINRPPVIIMDENDQNFSYSDGLVTVGELTFGFEVNEQLLMPEGNDDLPEGKLSGAANTEDKTEEIEEEKPVTSPASVLVSVPSCSIGEDFSTRYREPPTQPDNHDKIVTFVGLAWDDILKEMNGMSIHSGAKVQYYSGQ